MIARVISRTREPHGPTERERLVPLRRTASQSLKVAILLSFARWSAIHEASLGLVTSCAATSASAATSSAFVARKAEEFYRPRIQACALGGGLAGVAAALLFAWAFGW